MAVSTTGSQLVQDALFETKSYGIGDPLGDADAQFVLRRLNRMLDSWSNERNMIFGITQENFLMTAGVAQYSTVLLPLGRPVEIVSIAVTLNNIWWEVELKNNIWYESIPYKLTQAIPSGCYYDQAFPDAMFNFYPIPYAAFSCYVSSQRVLTTPVTLSTVLAMPEGYEAAIVDNLAVDIAPSFGKTIDPDTLRRAQQERRVLKRVNFQPGEMASLFAADGKPDPSNSFIYKGF